MSVYDKVHSVKMNKGQSLKKLGNAELRFFCTSDLLNEIYLHTKFHVDISYTYERVYSM
jgi:hypothetical protein